MMSQWLWMMVCYSEPVVVNHGVLCWASGCEAWWAIIEFNIRLYDKNSESDFFFLHQNQNIFFSNIGNQNIFLEKTIPPLQVKWSFPNSLEGGRWFSRGTLGTKNKTDLRDITEILLKVALNAMTIILSFLSCLLFVYETNWDMNYNLVVQTDFLNKTWSLNL
jgi:hypothetical protein